MRLSVRDLAKTYSPHRVLEHVSFDVAEGEFATILGKNASGKSTLLKIIAGVESATSGKVVAHEPLSYMPQEHALLPWRNVLENLFLPSDIRNVPRNVTRNDIMSLLAEFGLLRYADMYPATLSGGVRQKIALLRTILHGHSLLLLDEPFASLDALTRLEAQEWLQTLMRMHTGTTLLVTHDIREALFLSDTIYVMDAHTSSLGEKIPVPLPRPRRAEDMREPTILSIEAHLLSLLTA